MPDNKKNKPGLAQADEETKKRVSDAGHEAQGDKTNSDEDVTMEWEEEDYMVIPDGNKNPNLGQIEEDEDTSTAETRRRSENDQQEGKK